MSALDDIRRALTDAYGRDVIFDDLTANDLITAAVAENALDAEVYPGELLMLRGLVRVLRIAARQGDLAAVQQALVNHAVDDGDARDRTANTSSSSREARLAYLLRNIREQGGRWPVGRVLAWRRRTGGPPQRNTARHDLAELARRGHLQRLGPPDGQFYILNGRKGGA